MLERFAGRRLLLTTVGSGGTEPSPRWMRMVMKSHVQVYIVDGGEIEQKRVHRFENTDLNPGITSGELVDVDRRAYRNGVFHEINISTAVKGALVDARYYFNLEFTMPDAQSDRVNPITLTLLHAKDIYVEETELYTLEEQTAGGDSGMIRTTAQKELIIDVQR